MLDRFSQIQPKVIFSVNAVHYNGKIYSHLEKLQKVVEGMQHVFYLSGKCFQYFAMKALFELSHVMRKPAFCICENKGADQLCNNCAADQRLCFHYIDSTNPLLSKSEISSL